MVEFRIGPQPGFQRKFLATTAQIAIGGGAAGCGKTESLLYIPLYLSHIKNMSSIIFRRESKQITVTGGIWDQSIRLYSQLNPEDQPLANISNHEHIFPSGAKVQIGHLSDSRRTHLGYQGAGIAYIGFDELTHFEEHQFFYLLSRNRSTAVKHPFVRATCNPQGEGWVKDMVSWWLYPEDYKDQNLADYPIPERSGVIRYFTRFENEIVWADSAAQVIEALPKSVRSQYDPQSIKSFTFIPGKLEENVVLEKANPGYRASLLALPYNERMQLLHGRWRTVESDDNILFKRSVVDDFFTNNFVERPNQRYITADIAMEGRDKFVIMVWDGWVIIEIIVIPKSDGASVLEKLKRVAEIWKVPGRNIMFDASGMGGYLRGFLRNSVPFFGGNPPMEEDLVSTDEQKDSGKPKYFNLRSQTYYVLAQKLEDCLAWCQVQEYRELIAQELRATKKQNLDPDGKRRIIDKDEIKLAIGRSPDFADTISMRVAFDLKPPVKKFQRSFRQIR